MHPLLTYEIARIAVAGRLGEATEMRRRRSCLIRPRATRRMTRAEAKPR